MASLTRRRFMRDAAGAGAALTLPGLLLDRPRARADAGNAAEVAAFRDADYWAFADLVAPLLDGYWSDSRRHYAVPGGGETSFNADLLYVHAAAVVVHVDRTGRTLTRRQVDRA